MTGVSSAEYRCSGSERLLLLVICRICEYTRVKPTPDAITTLNCHAVLVCLQEFIIQDDRPLAMVHFSMAMRHKGGIRSLPTNVLCCEGLEGIRKLSFNKIEGSHGTQPKDFHAPSPDKRCVRTPDKKVSTFDPSTHSLLQDKPAIV
jgi:hypothetical protein